jgi:ketosteroid isomerase-like protein
VSQFVEKINARDVAGLVTLMSPDHRFVDSLGTVIRGRDVMAHGWRQYFAMVPDYQIDVAQAFAEGPDVVLLGSAGGTYSRHGEVEPANAWRTPAAWHAVVRDSLVAEWQVFADNDPIRKLMAQSPG